uniref:Uncharacterized protein n=1 Tax=Tetraselmis sp. GSL018 TaxID=582737 RepID=A0A061QRL9_9CHLO
MLPLEKSGEGRRREWKAGEKHRHGRA